MEGSQKIPFKYYLTLSRSRFIFLLFLYILILHDNYMW